MKHFKINILTIFFLLLDHAISYAKFPDEIIEGKKRGVLLITIYEKTGKKSRFIGSAFFTDNKGHFVTNYHILESYLNAPKDSQVQFQNIKGEEFTDVEIIKCGNENKIDLCYGKITTDKKVYFFDVPNRSPSKSLEVALIGQNGDYFSVKKGEILKLEKNILDKYGVPLTEQDNRNTNMILIGKYEYKSGFCKGDSGSPVFDYSTGDLAGVFTVCLSKKGEAKNKYAIDAKEVYSFIYSDSKFKSFKIPPDQIYVNPKVVLVPHEDTVPDKGDEFEFEKRTGQLEK